MNEKKIGVIVGRFQTPFLHTGHQELLRFLKKNHKKRLVVIGVSPTRGTRRDPLFADSREAMLRRFDAQLKVASIVDQECDVLWSEALDNTIRQVFPSAKKENVVIYGGRDSFIPHYDGIFDTQVFVPPPSKQRGISSTVIRKQVGLQKPDKNWGKRDLEYFQRGMIYSAENAFPRVFPTVDIAVTKNLPGYGLNVLLGRKYVGDKLRFPGGFVDPTDDNLEVAAKRELGEEVPGVSVEGPLDFVGSMLVEDWRYKGLDRIMTSFFHGEYTFGSLQAGDDLHSVGWYPLNTETRDHMRSYHQPLFDKLMEHLANHAKV